MNGQRVGYIRVSTVEQNADRQLEGIDLDRTFTDHLSGKVLHRPQLDAMLEFVGKGDTVLVHSMDRLARNLTNLHSLVRVLTARGVRVRFVKEQLTFTGKDTAMAILLLSVMGGFAEFERTLIKERQREGIALAKRRGAYHGRRKALNPEQSASSARPRLPANPKQPWPASPASPAKPSIISGHSRLTPSSKAFRFYPAPGRTVDPG